MDRIKELIAKDIFGCLTEEESVELQLICKENGLSDEDYKELKQRICSVDFHQKMSFVHTPRHLIKKILRYAAVLLLPIVLVTYIAIHGDLGRVQSDISPAIAENSWSNNNEVTLQLPGGKCVVLHKEESDVQITSTIRNNNKSLEYASLGNKASEDDTLLFNVLSTPADSRYKVCLADGSTIWLNRNTILRYPESFLPHERQIYLEKGEIYIEVAKDSLSPFRVYTTNGRIEVLGTHFNVCSVSADCIETTLLEGKVKLCNHGDEVILSPGEQAIMAENISVSDVDVEEVVSWKSNQFYFKDKSLEVILEKISSWYGVDVEWEEPVLKEEKYFLSLERYDSVVELLNRISEAGHAKFMVNGNKIKVYK